jgi:sensor histidine kinase regulating citrate/malate metabolism
VNNTRVAVSVAAPDGFEWVTNFSHAEVIMLIDNLLDNSQKADASHVEISFVKNGKSLEIHVADDGSGIEKQSLPHIFGFGFSTTHGSGIGLYHAEKIAKRLGGKIYANIERKSGAEFIIELSK